MSYNFLPQFIGINEPEKDRINKYNDMFSNSHIKRNSLKIILKDINENKTLAQKEKSV